jgi:hypothetical protein
LVIFGRRTLLSVVNILGLSRGKEWHVSENEGSTTRSSKRRLVTDSPSCLVQDQRQHKDQSSS